MHHVLDTETAPDGAFRLGVLMSGDGEPRVFRDAGAMRTAIESLPADSVVWGHNVQYDLLVLWHGAVGARFMQGRFRAARHRGVDFRDTFSFFEMPLSDAAPLVGQEKKGEALASHAYRDAELEAYCVQDCRATLGLVDAIRAFAGSVGVSDRSTGPGAWARALWADSCSWLGAYPDDLALRIPVGLVRGGLVRYEAGELGAGEKWDVKSAYPWMMLSRTYPDLRALTTRRAGGLPVLVRHRGTWYEPEEAALLGLRRPDKVIRCPRALWGRPFQGFVRRLMERRNSAKASGDRAADYLAKRALNSLTGCLGAHTRSTWIRQGIATGGQSDKPLPGTRSVWAALVTGRQRARLLRAWTVAREPRYSDTDSLVCLSYSGDSEGDALCGRWTLEERFGEAWILGPKMYATLDAAGAIQAAHVKGIPRRQAGDALRRFREGGSTVVRWDSVLSYREAWDRPVLWVERTRDPFRSMRQGEA